MFTFRVEQVYCNLSYVSPNLFLEVTLTFWLFILQVEWVVILLVELHKFILKCKITRLCVMSWKETWKACSKNLHAYKPLLTIMSPELHSLWNTSESLQNIVELNEKLITKVSNACIVTVWCVKFGPVLFLWLISIYLLLTVNCLTPLWSRLRGRHWSQGKGSQRLFSVKYLFGEANFG